MSETFLILTIVILSFIILMFLCVCCGCCKSCCPDGYNNNFNLPLFNSQTTYQSVPPDNPDEPTTDTPEAPLINP